MSNKEPRGLGRGLGAILGDSAGLDQLRKPIGYVNKEIVSNRTQPEGSADVVRIPAGMIEPNPFQPRMSFDTEALEELTSSIRSLGLIQPITVRRTDEGKYQIISGERRFRACKAAGMDVPGVVIHLEKHIPVAAGMGGGSADGATVLRLLQDRFHALSQEQLEAAAFSLGADVPFFLNPRPSHVTGAGEHIAPVDGLPEHLPILLAAPQFPVSAAWAYQHMDLARAVAEPPCTNELIDALRRRDFESAARFMRNDLEHALFVKFPLLDILRDFLLAQGALRVMVSGSGPTLLALFRDDSAARTAHARAAAEFDRSVRIILPA